MSHRRLCHDVIWNEYALMEFRNHTCPHTRLKAPQLCHTHYACPSSAPRAPHFLAFGWRYGFPCQSKVGHLPSNIASKLHRILSNTVSKVFAARMQLWRVKIKYIVNWGAAETRIEDHDQVICQQIPSQTEWTKNTYTHIHLFGIAQHMIHGCSCT